MSIVVRWRCDVCLDEMSGCTRPRGWTQASDEDGRRRDRCVDCSMSRDTVDDFLRRLEQSTTAKGASLGLRRV
jgi:hypothetical protein